MTGTARRSPWLRGRLPLAAALVLALAMLVGHQFPSGDTAIGAQPAAAGTAPGAASPAPPVDTAKGRIAASMHRLAPGEKPPQFLIFSFDGVGSDRHWQRILDLATRSEAHVTGFLSGLYLLDDGRRAEYTGPGHAPGKSSIGFGGPPEKVATLVQDLTAAVDRGHEIGTHYNGHFCAGSEPSVRKWNTAMWNSELDQFLHFVADARGRGLRLDPATIKGGRTPCLEGDWAQAVPSMMAHGLVYDSSRPINGVAWPTDEGSIREFWMPLVRVPALKKKVIMMDYNLWYSLNGARDQPARADEFRTVTLDTYRATYRAAFEGNRAPIVIGNHFNDWSNGAFSIAVEQFLVEACTKPETVCATYTEVSRWMDMQDPAVLAQLRALPHAEVAP